METIMASKKAKILVISDYTNFHSVRPEAEIFVSLARDGYDVTVMTFDGSEYTDRFRDAGIAVIDHHPTKRYQKDSIDRIAQELDSGKYDVIHLYNNKSIINGLQAARGRSVKCIGYRGSTLNFAWYNPFNFVKHLSPRLDFVICNSKGVADIYRQHPFFDSKKVVMINKGHDLAWYADIKPKDLRTEYKIPERTCIFILVATDRTMKGVKYLCEAVNQLPEQSDFRLFLIGGGMEAKKYANIVSRGPHKDSVITQSHNPKALSYVAGADVFVLPSIKGESITKAVLEAMSLGKCPIITDIAGNTELVTNGENGLVAKHGDAVSLCSAMQKVLNDKSLITKFGKASREKIAKELNHENTVDQYKQLYSEILLNPE